MRNNDGESQMMVTCAKKDLMEILEKNRTKHVEEYTAACKAFKKAVLVTAQAHRSTLTTFIDELEGGKTGNLGKLPELNWHHLPRPQSYEESYTRALGMLKLHTEDKLTLDMGTYRRYVEDDWEWSGQAKASNRSYLVGG